MKRNDRFFFRAWRVATITLALAFLAYLLYFHHLSSLVPGYSSAEIREHSQALNWHDIAANPVNAPYKVFIWSAAMLGHHSLLIARGVAAGFGVAAVALFYLVVRRWYSWRVSLLTTIMFATSAGLLHVARLGSAQILQLSLLLAIAAVQWYRRRPANKRRLAIYICLLVFTGLLYVPGMVWFELLGLILLRKRLAAQFKQSAALYRLSWVVVALAIIAPLGLAIIHTPRLAANILGVPESLHALSHFGSGLLHTLLGIGVHSSLNPQMWVGHAPLLNSVELVFATIGAYHYLYRAPSKRSSFLGFSTLIAVLLIALQGVASFTLLLPLLYIFVGSGLEQFLGQWLRVFPRNPIARSTGLGLVCVVVFFSVLYQTRSYFIAWHHNPVTRQTFDHPQP